MTLKPMRGVILAGGTGSRLMPLTKVTNKHLLPVGTKPMIYHPIEKLRQAEIDDILIVTGKEHMGSVVQLLGSGADWNCQFTYKVQDEAGGIAQALGLAEHFVGDGLCTVILGDNVFGDSLVEGTIQFREIGKGAQIFLKEVPDPHRFGVAEINRDRIVGIEEKPNQPKSKFAVTGIYMYDHSVFNIIKTLKPSRRGELEITDVNNEYLRRGELRFQMFKHFWTDAGTFESLQTANELVRQLP